jgi:polysaccharide export outer membrane protein
MRQRIWAMFAGLLALTALALPTFGQGQAQQKPPTTGASQSAAATLDPNYVIGPEDVLNIDVWKEAEISRSVPVRPDGKISLPLLRDVQAAGLTPIQLSQSITEKLKKFLAEPQVTVIVTAINSQRVYLIGEIGRPGAYPMLPGMTMLQAISIAGGLAQFANGKKIYLLRNENGKETKYPFNYKEVISGVRPEQNLVLKAGDTIVVP